MIKSYFSSNSAKHSAWHTVRALHTVVPWRNKLESSNKDTWHCYSALYPFQTWNHFKVLTCIRRFAFNLQMSGSSGWEGEIPKIRAVLASVYIILALLYPKIYFSWTTWLKTTLSQSVCSTTELLMMCQSTKCKIIALKENPDNNITRNQEFISSGNSFC